MPHAYTHRYVPRHPNAGKNGYVYEHILVASAALGKSLPEGAEIHHVNGNPRDNRPGNLVVCQDDAYHKLLHQRQRALRACGHADWRKCGFCKSYASVADLRCRRSGQHYHGECQRAYDRRQRAKRVAA